MHPVTVFQLYNLLAGIFTVSGFLYLLTRGRTIYSYHRFVHVLVAGLLVFAVGGPLADIFAPTFAHLIHAIAAILVIYGLYSPLHNDLRQDAWSNLILTDPSQVRARAEWMVPMDDDILELFQSHDLVLTPSIIAYNTGHSRESVNRQLGELATYDLIKRIERGKYRITPLGENYLVGRSGSETENRGREPRGSPTAANTRFSSAQGCFSPLSGWYGFRLSWWASPC
ncbi:MAG: ArsR family transcriptional regulator [Natronomonas sp.]